MHRSKVLNFFLEISNRCISNQLLRQKPSEIKLNVNPLRFCSNAVDTPMKSSNSNEEFSAVQPVEEIDLSEYGSHISPKFNFAMYADKSPVLKKYIDLGVNLFKIERRPKEAECLVATSLEKIESYLNFFKSIGVPDDKMGEIITKNPFIFKEDLDDLQVRVNYLISKKFDNEMISMIVTKCPKWLSMPVKVIDERLGHLQVTFKLTGDQIRQMVVKSPGIALTEKKRISINLFILKEEFALDEYALRKLVVSAPKLLNTDPHDLVSTYEYLVKTMKVPMVLILSQPQALRCRVFTLKERHKFLEYLGRAQYCQHLPGYVSLIELISTTDAEFCEKIAKTSVDIFYEYLKTL